MTQAQRAVFLTLIAALLWSLSGVFIKLIALDGITVVCLRSFFASLVLLPFLRGQTFRWSWAMLGGAATYTGFTYCIIISTKLTTSAIAVMMQYTAPIYVAFLSWFLLKERVHRADWLCLVAVLAGMALFFLDETGGGSLVGNIFALGNGIFFALTSIFLRFQKDGHPEQSIFLGSIFSTLLGLPHAISSLSLQPPTGQDIAVLIMAGIVVSLGYRLFTEASKSLTAVQTVMLPIIDPILNPIWVFFGVGERPSLICVCGGVIVLTAITIRSLLLIRAPGPSSETQ